MFTLEVALPGQINHNRIAGRIARLLDGSLPPLDRAAA
jgi:hypothetical protein